MSSYSVFSPIILLNLFTFQFLQNDSGLKSGS